MTRDVLALNCGSSSLKYALFHGDHALVRGTIKIGGDGPSDHGAAVEAVFNEIARRGVARPSVVGHRLVHGGPDHVQPARVTPALLASLADAVPFAPIHLPAELRAIEAVTARFGDLAQVVCFDTAFHRTLPERAQRFALPAALFASGVKRYGFHGLSYEYLVETLGAETLGRAVFAHLGSGASMAAIREGRSIDTTMGFTPAGGLVMGTRAGDLDPGLLVYLLAHRGYDARGLERLVNHEAGLKALSGGTSDMRELLDRRASDERAALAVDVFCYQARKWIGALVAALGGIETLVFTGGIGEHSPEVRREICRGLDFLGIEVDDARNDQARNPAAGAILSPDQSRCVVRVVATDEERMIARHAAAILAA